MRKHQDLTERSEEYEQQAQRLRVFIPLRGVRGVWGLGALEIAAPPIPRPGETTAYKAA